jgi:GNAT superfamily N-acetyltransferase
MNITVLEARCLDDIDGKYIAGHVCRDGSAFQSSLRCGEPAGDIAFCRDQGEIIGWARTERWEGYPTLESFVIPPYRGRGVATACAQALVANGSISRSSIVAVFRPQMESIAARCGLRLAAFSRREEDGQWMRRPPTLALDYARQSLQ